MLKDGDIDKLNGNNVQWEDDNHYRSMLSFSMACCEFLDNIGDMKFINTLPMTMKEFHTQASHIKERYVNICKIHMMHFSELGDTKLTGAKADKLDKYHQASLDSIKVNNKKEIEDMMASMLPDAPDYRNWNPEQIFNKVESQLEEGEKLMWDKPADDSAELRNSHRIIKKQKREIQSLKLHRNKPNQMQMKELIDQCRFENDKCNNTKLGKKLGIDPDTAKSWIEKLGLSDYAYNPKHLK